MTSPYLTRQLERWARPNAHLFVRPDWRRFTPRADADHPFALYEGKYRPDQPRVPAGEAGGGQWTGGGGEPSGGGAGPSADDSSRFAQYEFGTLIGQAVSRNGSGRQCFYRFSFGIVMVPGSTNLGCSSTLPSAGAVHGRLIGNDN